MDHTISFDENGEMYIEDIPGLGYEDKDLTDEDICKKYGFTDSWESA